MIINKFIKWGYFIVYTKEILAKDIAQIYIKEIFIIIDKFTKWGYFIVYTKEISAEDVT